MTFSDTCYCGRRYGDHATEELVVCHPEMAGSFPFRICPICVKRYGEHSGEDWHNHETIGTVPTWINGRWELQLPEYRAARREWPWWEEDRIGSMHLHLQPGDIVYDIGAEEGDMPALWAKWGCSVVLVEPNPKVWPNIRTVWEANGLPSPLGCFVGFAGEEDRDVHISAPWPECAYGPTIGDHGFLNLSERPDVPVVRVDTLATHYLPPTALTIDVEGAELPVLRGAERTLRVWRPRVWVSVHPEFSHQMYGVTRDELLFYMENLGYRAEHLATDHEEHWLFTAPPT